MFLATVRVTLKPTVNDPEGLTIARALGSLGFDSVNGVRSGKYIEITLDESDRADAEKRVTEMCEKLLANPVIERYSFDLQPA
ncbi:MAG: phosphoribosylformylglycinamidine synthase subunit PurS [Chloroflexi bacterium]|nr:phosphoribosylformylglycinamidine synthase subunit PurS [Chloroflexota bacterium]